jgi:predicted ATPase/DNA-binding winged helix-turn-helix (wHTH) protein
VIYRFDDCELDCARVVLRRGGRSVPIEPQVFDVLQCLVERRGRLVTKDELFDTVWGSRFVSETALTSRVKSARRAVGDDGTRQAIIRTVHGKGYRFIAEVTESDGPPHAADDGLCVPARPSPSAPHPSLPLPVHALIGRDELLDRLSAELVASRLLTIVGTAGVGKTSIAIELARRAAGVHRDGVHLVELVAVRDGDGALAAIATALDVNIRQEASLDTAIVDMLRARDLLLLIDNCEHLVEPIAVLADQILRTAPNVTIMATSREPLAIAGEHVHLVEPLDVGGLDDVALEQLAEVPAVALFVARARAVDAQFELTAATAPAVIEICRRLDGIPLALELAASRIPAIDVHEIARRLDERLRLLRAVRRGADPRHGTLVDAISWSYDLLEPDEQRLFTKLAVFAGSFDIRAAESVCDGEDVLDLLSRLSQRSMVAVRRSGTGGSRYELLETLREFGRTKLDDLGNVALFRAHAEHFASVAESIGSLLQTQDESAAIQSAQGSFADLRAAQRFALQTGDVDTAFRLIAAIREFGMRRLRYEVFSWADAAADIGEDHPLVATLAGMRAYGAFVRGDFRAALALADVAEGTERRLGVPATGLVDRVRANVYYLVGDSDRADDACADLIAGAQESGDASRVAHAMYLSSIGVGSVGDADAARERYEAAFAAAHRSGSPTDLAGAWAARGFASGHDAEAALDAFASADRLASSAGNRWMSAFARTEAGGLRIANGDLRRGCTELADTVDIWYRAGEWTQQWLTLSRCVIALDRIGQAPLAAEVIGAIERHTSVDAPPVTPPVRDLALASRASIQVQLGEDRTAELLTRGAHESVSSLVNRVRVVLLGAHDAVGA